MTTYLNDTMTVIAHVQGRPDVAPHARIVGRWVWVTFATKPGPDTRAWLKAEGFRWNRERGAWQHCGGVPSRHGVGDPRYRYGELSVQDHSGMEDRQCGDRAYEDACQQVTGA